MFNVYTLRFSSMEQNTKYDEFNNTSIRHEIMSTTLYLMAYALWTMISSFIEGQIVFTILCAFCILFVYGFKLLVEKYPAKLNFILFIYQIVLMCAFESNALMSSTEKMPSSYAWYFGFQASFMHFSLFLQGSDLIFSSITLLVVICFHLLFSPFFQDGRGVVQNLSFVTMMAAMLTIRYTYEKQKKQQFLNSQQQKRWIDVINESVQYGVLLLQYQKRDQQLHLLNQNRKAEKMFNIQDNQSMRDVLRRLIIQDNFSVVMSEQAPNYKSIEQAILQLLKSEDFNTATYTAVDRDTQSQYKVKMGLCLIDSNIQCMLEIKWQKQQLKDKIQLQQKLLKEILEILESNSADMLIKCQGNILNYQAHNILLNLRYLLYVKEDILLFQKISPQNMKAQLQRIFRSCDLSLSQTFPFNSNLRLLLQLIIGISSIITHLNPQNRTYEILFTKYKEDVICTIQSKVKSMNDLYVFHLRQLIEQNWIQGPQQQFRNKYIFQQTLDYLVHNSRSDTVPLMILFNIAVIQLILSRIGQVNHFASSYENDIFSIQFVLKQLNNCPRDQSDIPELRWIV